MGRAEYTRPIEAEDVEEVTGITIDLSDLKITPEKSVLDIGAGGQAMIFRALRREIYGLEAAEEEINVTKELGVEEKIGANINWYQGDARDIPLDDEMFDVTTSFFTCMYLRSDDCKKKLFKECFRLLRAGGAFYLWDFNITTLKKVFVGKILVKLPENEQVEVAYGLGGEMKEQTLEKLIKHAEKAGFNCEVINDQQQWFLLRCDKQ